MDNPFKKLKIPKWPFLLGQFLLLGTAYFVVTRPRFPISKWEVIGCLVIAAIGTFIGIFPFILDYRAIGKLIEAESLGTVAEKIQNLEKLAAQISSATNEWMNAQTQAEKTSAGAKEISEKMAAEVREFSGFMQKMNDSEKSALRLEIEKFRRAEAEWVQVLVRVLDHVFVLHGAAVRSGQPKLAEQITQFQNACRDTVRRVGLTPFIAEPDEPFNAQRHEAIGVEEKPSADAIVAETVGAGFTFQGKMLRPALVRLRETNPPVETPAEEPAPVDTAVQENADDELSLEPPD